MPLRGRVPREGTYLEGKASRVLEDTNATRSRDEFCDACLS